MKTNNLVLTAIFATASLSQITKGQNHHPALQNVISKINTDGEYMSITKLNGDIGAIKQYIDVILKVARQNGESIPPKINAQELFKISGLDTLKASGSSAKELENAWINHTYIENGGSNAGIFSLIGKKNQEHIAANFLPAETDLALQLQLDLRKLTPMLIKGLELDNDKTAINDLTTEVPELEMSPQQVLEKLNLTISLGIDVNTDEKARNNPFSVITGANAIIRIDGLTWLWDKIEVTALQQAELPLNRSEDPSTGIITFTVNEDKKAQLMGYNPQVIIDKKNDHIWITTNPEFYSKCKSTKNKLVNSATFKAAMELLPSKANSMLFVSRDMLLTAEKQYELATKTNMLDAEIMSLTEVIDRLMEDLTESDKGWAMVLNKDETGVMLASRGPAGIQHLDYLSKIMSIAAAGSIW